MGLFNFDNLPVNTLVGATAKPSSVPPVVRS